MFLVTTVVELTMFTHHCEEREQKTYKESKADIKSDLTLHIFVSLHA